MKNPRIASELVDAFQAIRTPLLAVAAFSFGSNILFLALPIYIMQLYGRVVPSQSLDTLLLLTLITIFAFMIATVLDDVRSRILVRIGGDFDRVVAPRLFSAMVAARIRGINSEKEVRSQAARDLDALRQAIAGNVTTTLFDLPWAPLFLIPIFIASFWLGFVALLGAAGLVALALLNRRYTQQHFDAANRSAHGSYALAENALRNSEVVYAMGMEQSVGRLWTNARRESVQHQQLAIARSSWFASAIKFVRVFMQVLIMALAAVMVLAGAIGPGVMFAASLLFQRAISPVERLVGSWRSISEARLAFSRLNEMLLSAPPSPPPTQLPELVGAVDFENVSYASSVTGKSILRGIRLSVSPGETVGVIGPSGAGKSTFLKMICGVLAPSLGTVRIDGADLRTWDRGHFGRFVGYLPQDVELFSGTVAENISRFERDADPKELFQAARMAGVHELILGLPSGYDTQLGDGGSMLSAGQRQRIGLARALYRAPRLLLLDEPNANLDTDGDTALGEVLKQMKLAGTTVFIISHRSSALVSVDKLLYLMNGAAVGFGSRELVAAQMKKAVTPVDNAGSRGKAMPPGLTPPQKIGQ